MYSEQFYYTGYLQTFINKARETQDYDLLRTNLPFYFNSILSVGRIAVQTRDRLDYCVFCTQTADYGTAQYIGCANYHVGHWHCLYQFLYSSVYTSGFQLGQLQCPQCKAYLNPDITCEVLSYQPAAAPIEEPSREFKCEMCWDTGKVNREVTLSCNHIFHKACLQDLFENLIDERKVKESDITCPMCQKPIQTRFLQLVSPQRFGEYNEIAFKQNVELLADEGEKAS